MNLPINRWTAAKLAALTVGGLALAMIVPTPPIPAAAGISLAGAMIVSAVLSVLLKLAATRRRDLFSTVYLELNKLRRIYHISKNLAASGSKHRIWFTDLHGFLYGYLSEFSGRSLTEYNQTNPAFRKLSYHIYTVPELATDKERALYEDLLQSTATIAESRQRIKDLLSSRLSAYSWVVVLLLVMAFSALVLLAAGPGVAERVAAGTVLASVLLAVDLLWELDTMRTDLRDWARRYVDNVSKLELGRRGIDE
ncbi:MAG: hypothetical protein WCT10_00060 [Patescibacteria group bacterium]|jgi:hypothetical protein